MTKLPFRDINFHSSISNYSFTSPSSPTAATLIVDRPSGNIRLENGVSSGTKRVSSIFGILGIIKLRLGAQKVGTLRGHVIYKINATELLSLRERALHDQDEDNYLDLLRTLLKSSPMYFSYSLDLTNTFQRQSQSDTSCPLWKRADNRFFWNKYAQSDLIEFRISGNRQQPGPQSGIDPYILPVISGMLKIIPTHMKHESLTLCLITRQSRLNAGTRYFSRGIDERGNVSNFNETEQIVILNDSLFGLDGFGREKEIQGNKVGDSRKILQISSYVQTRGSVPIYWIEVNNLYYTPRLQIRGIETAVSAAKTHFDEQIRHYGDNYLINLVKHTGREQAIKEGYEKMVRLLTSKSPNGKEKEESGFSDEKIGNMESSSNQQITERLHYIYFDFHHETRGFKWQKINILLDQLRNVMEKQQYFRALNTPGDTAQLDARNQQTSVFRTNCMDSLDRTNIVQSLIAKHVLNRQLIDMGVLNRHENFASYEEFDSLFRNLWADNADVVAKSYAGTGALNTELTRSGVRTKAGMFQDLQNALSRYVKNNFSDGQRQDAFDLFLGVHVPSIGSDLIFMERRPILIQSIPYILLFSIFFVLIGLFTRRLPDAAVFPVKVFTLFWFAVGSWCIVFILNNGMLYVNWPRLVPRTWAVEGYQEAFSNVLKDRVIGPLVTRHERGLSTVRYTNAEEGKKRIE